MEATTRVGTIVLEKQAMERPMKRNDLSRSLVVASIGSLPRFTRGEEKGTPYPAFACGGWLIESRTVP